MGDIGFNSYEPVGVTKHYRKFATSANADQQLCRLPWFWSQGGISGKIIRLTVGNPSGALVTVRFWDQDLSNASPPSKGSGSVQGALMIVSAAGSGASGTQSSTTLDINQCNFPEMYSGIAFQVSDVNVQIFAEVRLK